MTKEVRFDIYCKECKHYTKSATDDPCNHCLGNPSNEDSHVPVDFKQVKALINYLTPDPNVTNYTRDRMKSKNWVDAEPTDLDLKKYFKMAGEDWYEC